MKSIKNTIWLKWVVFQNHTVDVLNVEKLKQINSCDFEPDTIEELERKLKMYQTKEYYKPIINQLEKVIVMLTSQTCN